MGLFFIRFAIPCSRPACWLPKKARSSIAQLEGLLPIEALPLGAAEHYGQIRADLHKQGLMMGNNNLWLAAHARAQGWILVTNNERVFMRINGLQVENWV